METKEQKLPKLFTGQLYEEGSTVQNPFSGAEYELNNVELSMYDFILGANFLYERGAASSKTVNDLRKGLSWFRKNNGDAYMVLLD